MSFDHIPGNQKVKTYLTRMLNKGRLGQAYLFAGPEGVGKSAFAEAFASMITPSTPDIHPFCPEGKLAMHSIEAMRQLSEQVSLKPYSGEHQVFIIYDADRMPGTSANALLKTFEEPSPGSVIILVSSCPEHILPTVLSRCMKVHFQHSGDVKEQEESPLVQQLMQLLITAPHEGTYPALVQQAKAISDALDTYKEETRKQIKEEQLKKLPKDSLTPALRHALEKEADGVVSLQFYAQVEQLLTIILSWYRDLTLLATGGDTRLLMNKNYQSFLEESLSRFSKRGIPSLFEIEKELSDSKMKVMRQIPFSFCLESFFIKFL
jgi:DNA polymerase-3 subunit delta'